MNYPVEKATGVLKFLGASRIEGQGKGAVRTYDSIRLSTSAGTEELHTVGAAANMAQFLKAGRTVTLVYSRFARGVVVFAVQDVDSGEVITMPDVLTIRSAARAQSWILSFQCLLFIPLGLVFFVVPGLIAAWSLAKSWHVAGRMPTPEEIQAVLQGLTVPAQSEACPA